MDLVWSRNNVFKNAQFKITYVVNTRKTPVEVDCFTAIFKYALPSNSLAFLLKKKKSLTTGIPELPSLHRQVTMFYVNLQLAPFT